MLQTLIAIALLVSSAFGQSSDEYEIGAGDRIQVTVHGHDFGRQEFVVGANGDISFPYVGSVQVSGHSTFAAEDELEKALSNGYLVDPQVTIQVTEFRSQRVDLLGAVAKPGVYYLDGPTSLRSLLGKAGGAQLDKSSGQILITRGRETIHFEIEDLKGPEGDLQLQVGDLAGQVAKPGAITFTDGMTVSQALIKAGGDTGLGRLSGAYVLRSGDRIGVNLRRILKGKDSDLMLQAGDKVVVPESAI